MTASDEDIDDRIPAKGDDAVRDSTLPRAKRFSILLFRTLILATLVVQFSNFERFSARYPFYFLWDMDELAATDTIGINSGLIPRLLLHPGFGMHFFQHLVYLPAHKTGLVTARDMRDLESSLNPFLLVAETTDYLREFPPLLSFGIVVCLWLSIVVQFRASAGWSLLTLLAISTQQSLLYQSSTIRFETYAAFYWSAALLLVVLAARSRSVWGLWGFLVCAGLLLGLSYSSKVQAIFYVIALPFIGLFLLGARQREGGDAANPRISLTQQMATLAPALIGFIALLTAAMRTDLPNQITNPLGDSSWHIDIGRPIVGLGVALVGGALILVISFLMIKRLRVPSETSQVSGIASCLFLGFVLSLGFHFFLYRDAGTSYRYMLYDMKFMFALPVGYQVKDFWTCVETLRQHLSFSAVTFAVYFGALLMLCLAGVANWLSLGRFVPFYLLVASSVILPNLAFCARLILRDLTWAEILPAYLAVLALIALAHTATKHVLIIRCLSAVGIVALAVSNYSASRLAPERLDANYNAYGWDSNPWFGTLLWDSEEYKSVLRTYDEAAKETMFASAKRHTNIKRMGDFVFKNVDVDLHNVGVISEGLPIWRDEKSFTIAKFPPTLRGALAFDVRGLKARNEYFFKRADRPEDYLDKIVPPPSERHDSAPSQGEWVSVLGRLDLSTYIFVSEADRDALAKDTPGLVPVDFSITMRSGQESRILWGVQIINYSEIPVSRFSSRYVFVVAPRTGTRSAWLALWP